MSPRLLALVLLALAACSAPGPAPTPDAGSLPDAGGTSGPEVGEVRVGIAPDTFCASCYELNVGQSRKLAARVFDTEGHELTEAQVVWSSADESLAVVASDGLVTARAPGDVAIRASVGGKSGEQQFHVLAPQVFSIVVTPDQASVEAGHTLQLTARAQDEFGGAVTGVTFHWAASNPQVATVDAGTGLVTATGPGDALVQVSTETGGSGWMALTVTGGTPPPKGFSLAQTAMGDAHTCGLDAQGKAWCWGWNFFGQMGNGQRGGQAQSFPRPQAVKGGKLFQSLELGMYHSCAVTAEGEAWCWGSNSSGQLGTHEQLRAVGGTTEPYLVLGQHHFTRLAAGGSHTCALTDLNETLCWGGNFAGQLGQGDLLDQPVPKAIAGAHVFQQIAAGLDSTCALDASGKPWCWGSNAQGQLGTGAPPQDGTHVDVPTEVQGNHVFQSLSLQSSHACALTRQGEAWCWGNNAFGQLGDGSTEPRSQPVKVTTTLQFQAIATGAHHTCALDPEGAAYCWGNDDNGQLGNHTLTASAFPTEVAGGHRYVHLASGANQICGVTTEGETLCWGSSYTGETGAGFAGDGTVVVAPWPLASP